MQRELKLRTIQRVFQNNGRRCSARFSCGRAFCSNTVVCGTACVVVCGFKTQKISHDELVAMLDKPESDDNVENLPDKESSKDET